MTSCTKKLIACTAACVVLLGVFALYAQPQTMVALQDMLWACFN